MQFNIVPTTLLSDTITRPGVGSGWWDGTTGNVSFKGASDPRTAYDSYFNGVVVGNCVRFPLWFDDDIMNGEWFEQNAIQDQTNTNVGTFYCREAGTYNISANILGLLNQQLLDLTNTLPIYATLYLLGGSSNSEKPAITGNMFSSPVISVMTSLVDVPFIPIGSASVEYSVAFDEGSVFQLVVDICNLISPNTYNTTQVFNVGYDGIPVFNTDVTLPPVTLALGNSLTVTKLR